MGKKIKIFSLAVLLFFCTAFMNACSNSSSGMLYSVYESDKNNDGVVDAVYRYSLDFNSNMIKVEIDPDNDGRFHEGCCYDLGSETNKNLLKKSAGS